MGYTHEPRHVHQGDLVAVRYRGTLQNGAVFGANLEGEPLRFVVGRGEVIAGVEQAVMGMAAGEKKTATVEPTQAFGTYHDDYRRVIGRDQLPSGVTPHVGEWVRLTRPGQGHRDVRLIEVRDDSVTVDENHPLAGQTLTIDLEVLDVTPFD